MQKFLVLIILSGFSLGATAQQAAIDSSEYAPLSTLTATEDQALMMQQLGITKLRPGPSGNECITLK